MTETLQGVMWPIKKTAHSRSVSQASSYSVLYWKVIIKEEALSDPSIIASPASI